MYETQWSESRRACEVVARFVGCIAVSGHEQMCCKYIKPANVLMHRQLLAAILGDFEPLSTFHQALQATQEVRAVTFARYGIVCQKCS